MALPSCPSAGYVPSAGVAVFVRSECGVRAPQLGMHQVCEHRVQHVQLDIPGWPTLHLVNMYLYPSIGPQGNNAKLSAAAGAVVESVEGPCIVGCDRNMSPYEVQESGFCSFAGLTLVSTKLRTCRGGTGSSIIDYFGLNDPCMRAYNHVKVDASWSIRPHRPVQLAIASQGFRVQHFVYTVAPSLSISPPIGPRPEPPDWGPVRGLVERCVEMAGGEKADPGVAHHLLSTSWG
eukprot:54618-Pyramimonas_sp.AAC.1